MGIFPKNGFWAYFLPWAFGIWTFGLLAFAIAVNSAFGWLVVGVVWLTPFLRPLADFLRRLWGSRHYVTSRSAKLITVLRNRHLIGAELNKKDRALLKRLEAAERYLAVAPVNGLRGFLHRRRIRRRIAEVRYLIGSASKPHYEKIDKHLGKLRTEIDEETDAAIERHLTGDTSLSDLREHIDQFVSAMQLRWQDGGGNETLRQR